MSQINWQPIDIANAQLVMQELNLVGIAHSAGECNIWYPKEQVDACKTYSQCTPILHQSWYDWGFKINTLADGVVI